MSFCGSYSGSYHTIMTLFRILNTWMEYQDHRHHSLGSAVQWISTINQFSLFDIQLLSSNRLVFVTLILLLKHFNTERVHWSNPSDPATFIQSFLFIFHFLYFAFRLSRDMNNKKVSCEAKNNDINDPKTRTVTIQMNCQY